jgi:hypothetical protein
MANKSGFAVISSVELANVVGGENGLGRPGHVESQRLPGGGVSIDWKSNRTNVINSGQSPWRVVPSKGGNGGWAVA